MKQKLTPSDLALWAALPMVHTTRIEERLKKILDTTRRQGLTRPALITMIVLASGLALGVATAYTPPRSLVAAITSGCFRLDTPAHLEANIGYLRAAIHRFGDKDPWAGKAYYVLGSAQMGAGRPDDALASFDKAAALPEPPYANSGIHSSARFERINALDAAGRHMEAVAETEALLKGGERGLITADLWENLRKRLPESRLRLDAAANSAAERGQYRALSADLHWSCTLANGVTVQLLGIMRSAGNRHTVWSPEGKRLSTAQYKSVLGEDSQQMTLPTKQVRLILGFSYPAGRAILTEYALSGAGGSSFQSGLARSNGIVVTDEEEMNLDTAGRRTVQAWFPLKQLQTDLRVGVALEPPPTGPTDSADVPKEWAEFPEVTLPPVG